MEAVFNNPNPILEAEEKYCAEDESCCLDDYPGGHYYEIGYTEYFCPGGIENV